MQAAGQGSGALRRLQASAQVHPFKGFEIEILGGWLASARNDEDYRNIRVAILASPSSQPLANATRVAILKEGFFGEVYEAPYGAFQQDILTLESGLYAFRPDLVVLALGHEGLENLPKGPMEASDLEVALNVQLQWMHGIWTSLTQKLGVPVLQHSLVTPVEVLGGPAEKTEAWTPASFIEKLNRRMRETAPVLVHWVDVDQLSRAVGLDNWHDPRLWHHAKYGFATRFLPEYADWLGATLRGVLGLAPKALICDLDHTLWGGVIGDDGLDGVRLGPDTAEGEAYQAFCRYIKALGQRGVMLGICSKNESANVVELFDKHPHMPLKWNDFAAVRCNWEDKVTNLMGIAKELNIDPSAMVFIDDNPAECELVSQRLPMVRVVQLNGDPASFIQTLDRRCLFHAQRFLKEDLNRTLSYQALAKSENLKNSAKDLASYLQSLEMTGEVSVAVDSDLTRLTQMEMKTNQFNLTTRRWNSNQISEFMSSKSHHVLCLRLKDRFADYGLVGSMIVEYGCKEARILSWLLSCRVFSRTCEEFMMDNLIVRAKKKGVLKISGQYIPTEKNQVVQDLYIKFGFAKLLHQQIFECDITSVTARSSKIKEGIV